MYFLKTGLSSNMQRAASVGILLVIIISLVLMITAKGNIKGGIN